VEVCLPNSTVMIAEIFIIIIIIIIIISFHYCYHHKLLKKITYGIFLSQFPSRFVLLFFSDFLIVVIHLDVNIKKNK
jgi:hypothetical protein